MTQTTSDVVRRRRLAEVWRASAPSRDEIVHLRVRLGRRSLRPRASRGKVIIVALVQGLFFGAATLATAAWIAGKAAPRAPLAAFTSAHPAPAPVTPARSGTATVGEPEPPAPPPAAAFDGVADEAPSLARSDALHVSGSGRIRTSARALLGKSATAQPVQGDVPPPEGTASAPVIVAAPDTDGPWSRVAQAIADRDWTGAERALNDLSSNADPATRDAAELARVELAIARGQTAALRPLVERLARSGATGLIRKRALALLERLPSR